MFKYQRFNRFGICSSMYFSMRFSIGISRDNKFILPAKTGAILHANMSAKTHAEMPAKKSEKWSNSSIYGT